MKAVRSLLCAAICSGMMISLPSCSARPADAVVKPAVDTAVEGKITAANSKAREAFSAASDYCAKCAVQGVRVSAGWFVADVGRTSAGYKEDGKDIENALSYAMGSTDGAGGYAAVKIDSNGSAVCAYWASANVFAGMSSAELDALAGSERVCASEPFAGGYPDEFKAGDHNTLSVPERNK